MASLPVTITTAAGVTSITGPQGVFSLIFDSNGYYAYAVGQHVDVNGSPVIVKFDPPIAPTVDAGTVYQDLLAILGS